MTTLLLLLSGLARGAEPAWASALVGLQLPEGDGMYERWDPARAWGTSFVAPILQNVAAQVALQLPLADPLLVGDISRRGGGAMPGHSSHDQGVDVDLGLFMDDGRQPLGGFVNLRPGQLDVASTWVLIRTLLETGQVEFILLDQSLIDRLKGHLRNDLVLDGSVIDSAFPPSGRPAEGQSGSYVRHAPNHRNHLHVRLRPPPMEPAAGTPEGSDATGASFWY